MHLIWDEEKNKQLIMERGISFDTVGALILEKKYAAILKNPTRKGQKIFVIPCQGYTYVVPFVVDDEQNLVLKTVYPSRKYHKLYGGKDE
jgi:uncharacterized DUF497 family protein